MSDPVEFSRAQLVQSLSNVADSLRNCAAMAEQFASVVKHVPIGSNMRLVASNMDGTPPVASSKRKAAALEGEVGEGGKKKRVRKPRDPNAPKRPPSSYILFQNDIRRELKKKNPNLSQSELLTMISKQWATMTDDQKTVYNKANADAKEKYSVAKSAYDARDANSPVVDATSVASKPPKTPAPSKTPKSAPVVVPGSSSETSSDDASSGSEESSEDDSDEEELTQPITKKAKTVPTPSGAKEKKQKKVSKD